MTGPKSQRSHILYQVPDLECPHIGNIAFSSPTSSASHVSLRVLAPGLFSTVRPYPVLVLQTGDEVGEKCCWDADCISGCCGSQVSPASLCLGKYVQCKRERSMHVLAVGTAHRRPTVYRMNFVVRPPWLERVPTCRRTDTNLVASLKRLHPCIGVVMVHSSE